MAPYVIVDTTENKNLDLHADPGVDVMIYLDDVLPVFTSPQSLWEFVQAWHSEQNPIRATPLEVDPITLATMAEEFEATAGLKWLIFDPRISSRGWWILPKDPISASSYCREIVELARGVKKMFAEGRATLADECSSPEELNKIVAVWVALQAEKVDADARARAKEWEIEDDSWRR